MTFDALGILDPMVSSSFIIWVPRPVLVVVSMDLQLSVNGRVTLVGLKIDEFHSNIRLDSRLRMLA